jgi:DtxR family Mn-dependent transcriptional regulator
MVRRHRLLETFFHRALRVPLERVHAEAERVEHVISDDVAMRIAALLGRPRCDPHGHPIPYGNDPRSGKPLPTLAGLRAGDRAKVVSLDDRDDEAVALLAKGGLLPGARILVERVHASGIVVRRGKRAMTLRRSHAEMVRIGA